MFATLILSMVVIAADDPFKVPDPYVPQPNERGVIMRYSPKAPPVTAWVNAGAKLKFDDAAGKLSSAWLAGTGIDKPDERDRKFKEYISNLTKLRQDMIKHSEAIELPDGTPVMVRATAQFRELPDEPGFGGPSDVKAPQPFARPDELLVELLADGPRKGHLVWVGISEVRFFR
jgi:hypothetical protein